MAKKNDVCRCIARVYRWGALRPHRCANPVWKDGYCKTHQQSAHAAIAEKDKEIERLRSELKLAYAIGKQDITIYDAETLLKEDGDG